MGGLNGQVFSEVQDEKTTHLILDCKWQLLCFANQYDFRNGSYNIKCFGLNVSR